MPPITASSWRRWAIMRLVMSKRFITFACSRRTGRFAGRAPGSAISPLLLREDFAAGQQRVQNETAWRLGRERLRNRAIHDELHVVDVSYRGAFDQQRIQHRPHRARDHLLTDVEF